MLNAMTKESKNLDGHHAKLVEPIKEEEIDSDCLVRTGNGEVRMTNASSFS